MRLLTTRAARALFVALCLLVAAAIGLWYFIEPRQPHPAEWYAWTQGSEATQGEAGIDVRSPTGRAIAVLDFIPQRHWIAYESMNAAYRRRCDIDALASRGLKNVSAEYRGVLLCNSGLLASQQEFDIAHSYFRFRVDELYSRWYSRITGEFAKYVFGALIIWCALLLGWRTYLWIVAGSKG
jgi:hypothetical protein